MTTAIISTNGVTQAYISSIAKFSFASSILSFGQMSVDVRVCKTSEDYLIEKLDDYDEKNSALYCVVVGMFSLQPKSVQDCHLFYQPNLTFVNLVRSTIFSVRSEYQDMSHSLGSGSVESKNGGTICLSRWK